MKIKTLIRFSDLKENTIREVGEEFEATSKRVEELLSLSPNPIIEIIEVIEVIETKTVKEDNPVETAIKKKK